MDVAFVGRFMGGHRDIVAAADASGLAVSLIGRSDPLDDTLCRMVVSGEMEAIVPDVSQHALAAVEPIVEELAIAAYLGVPVRLENGSVYGTLCCLARDVRTDLTDADVALMTARAAEVARIIDDEGGDLDGTTE